MRGKRAHILLLTGSPGVGKTTLVRRIIERLPAIRPRGFYTEELRERGERRGFRAVSFDDTERIMAHVDLQGPHRVGKYVVDVAAIDEIARTSLSLDRRHRVYVIDEIGRMECLSNVFVDAVTLLLASEVVVIATIGARGGGFIAETKARGDVELWQVTSANRDELVARGVRWTEEHMADSTRR
jgi:nucleoside-triphosphatase